MYVLKVNEHFPSKIGGVFFIKKPRCFVRFPQKELVALLCK